MCGVDKRYPSWPKSIPYDSNKEEWCFYDILIKARRGFSSKMWLLATREEHMS
jgi:hypothetical protein